MKSLLENLRESMQVNECGGRVVWNSCGGNSYADSYYRYIQVNKEGKEAEKCLKALSEIPEDDVLKFIELTRNVITLRREYNDSRFINDIYQLKQDFDTKMRTALGVDNVYKKLTELIKRKTSICRTGTQTVNVLKMIALMMSEEYSEANMNDPKFEKAFKKIIDEI
jgi:hypothetical protein